MHARKFLRQGWVIRSGFRILTNKKTKGIFTRYQDKVPFSLYSWNKVAVLLFYIGKPGMAKKSQL